MATKAPPQKQKQPQAPAVEGGSRKEDILLAISLGVGVLVIGVIIWCIPAGTLNLASVQRMFSGDQESEQTLQQDMGRGLFALGKVQLSLANKTEYLDSSIDLEYDRGVLRIASNGEIIDDTGASSFFGGEKDRIKDAIISAASGFSWRDVTGKSGLEGFRTHLIEAVNESLPQTSQDTLITNLYFRSFILFPPEDLEGDLAAKTTSRLGSPSSVVPVRYNGLRGVSTVFSLSRLPAPTSGIASLAS